MIVFDLSVRLMHEHCKNHTLYKQDCWEIALCNVLGNLFIRNQKAEYVQEEGKKQHGLLLYPLNNSLFSKTKLTGKSYAIMKKNIAELGITKNNKKTILDILIKNRMCSVVPGKCHGKNTAIFLNNPLEWIEHYLCDSIVDNLKLYAAVYGTHFDPIKYDNYKEDIRPIACIKIKVNDTFYYIKASDEAIAATTRINNLWPDELKSLYSYRRIYIDDELKSGRFYSLFTYMPKGIRKLLMEKSGYVEIDISGFVPNVLKQFMDEEYFTERPYKVVARQLLKQKYKNAYKYLPEDFIESIADCIKQVVLIILNNDNIEIEDINKIDKNRQAWNILIECGLANTNQELAVASNKYKAYQEPEKYKYRQEELYEMRKYMWELTPESHYPCPNFVVKPSNVLTAMKKAMPELVSFNLTSNWDWTQLIEAELLVSLSIELETDQLLPLFIHDALYVPSSFKDKYSSLAYSILPTIVNSYKLMVFDKENVEYTYNSFSSLVISSIDKVELNNLKDRYKANLIKDKEIQSIVNKVKRTIPNKLINFYRDEYNRFILPKIIKEQRNMYQLIKVIILNKLKE